MLLYDALKKSNKGFTLVEMIAAVVIVGIIASLGVPNLLGMLYQARVKDGLGQVEGAIREAQKLAVRQGKVCKIRFSSNASGDSIVQVSPNETIAGRAYDYSGCLLSNRQLPDSVSFELLNAGSLVAINSGSPRDLGFSPKGNPNITGIMVISHSQATTQKCVQIQGLLGSILTGDYDSTTQQCEAQ